MEKDEMMNYFRRNSFIQIVILFGTAYFALSAENPCQRALRANFLESIQSSIQDLKTRHDLLIEFGFSEEKSGRILNASFIQGDDAIERQNKILGEMRLTEEQRKFIEDNDILQLSVYEYQRLMTRAPISRIHLRPSVTVSYPSKNGILENVIIDRVEGENLYVSSKSKNEKKFMIKKKDAYNPISFGQEIVYDTRVDIPKISEIFDDAYNEKISIRDHNRTIDILDINQLGVRPRVAVNTRLPDFSSPLNEEQTTKLKEDIDEISFLYARYGINELFVEKSNTFLKNLQQAMRRQGVFASLSPQEETLKLTIDGVHPYGNIRARQNLKKTLLHGFQNLTVSPGECCANVSSGFIRYDDFRLEMGPLEALDMLKGNPPDTFNHEFRHLFLHTRKTVSINSLYNHELFAIGTKKLFSDSELYDPTIFKNFYEMYLDMSELYAQAFDIPSMFQLFKRVSEDEKTDAVLDISYRVLSLTLLSDGLYNLTKNMLKNFNDVKVEFLSMSRGPVLANNIALVVSDIDDRGMKIQLQKDIADKVNLYFAALHTSIDFIDPLYAMQWQIKDSELEKVVKAYVKDVLINIKGLSLELIESLMTLDEAVIMRDINSNKELIGIDEKKMSEAIQGMLSILRKEMSPE